MNNYVKALSVMAVLLIAACGQPKEEQEAIAAITIESADECHLCGMIIEGFSGPKGAVTHKTESTPRKFCSTRDMFAYYLDPEHKRNVKQLLVHDMSKVPWETPDDELLIDAKKAWFVVGSSQTGAMGQTLASFSEKNIAERFINQYGGTLLRFEDINNDIINEY